MPLPDSQPTPPPARNAARVVVAGFGLVTPLGTGAWPTYRALLAGRSITDRIDALPDGLRPAEWVAALGGVSAVRHSAVDPAVELAERAAREAAAMAGRPVEGLPMLLGTSKGAVARVSTQLGMGRPLDEAGQHTLALGPHGYLSHTLARRMGTQQRVHCVAACASGLTALDTARRRLALAPDDRADDYALVVSADAALTPTFVHSYLRLGVLAEPTPAGYRERPLDARRLGFMLSEMGVAVLLRRLPRGETPAPGETELLDTATCCEAQDLLRPSPTMDALRHVAGRLFAAANANNQRVDVLHPHAPGTPDHDPRELSALLQTLSNSREPGTHGSPPVGLYACKGALGHALGASGLASLVLALLALRTGKLPPMPWLQQPIDLHGATASQHPTACNDAGTHAVFAAGFGGHTAGALLHRHPKA